MAAEEPMKRADCDPVAALIRETRAQFLKGDVRRVLDRGEEKRCVRFDAP
ncbi:MAG: hypothetical protein AAF322_02215 [Pseudomonadota bacterium]